ncbi:ABC transporter substrate-binding protein [Enemella sp. A6]|uniref:ABC transporter substrate-binding protein n=1 Tax=Enemella sp. A6 TaxID=3440152 RepID=UPI003EBBF480
MSLLRSKRVLAGLGVLALSLSACVSAAPPDNNDGDQGGSGDGTIKIGAVMASSGFMGPIDTPAIESMKVEIEKINAEGGIDGQQVELALIDTGTKLERYASAAKELLEQDAKVILVTCDYDVSSPASKAAEDANVLHIAPCVGDPIYGPQGGWKIGFSMGAGNPGEASNMAEFSYDKGWRKAVTLTDTSLKYTQNQCEIFKKRFTELGGEVTANYDFSQGDSIRESVSRIASGPAPDVIVNCSYNPGGGTAAKEIRDGGLNMPVISGFGQDGDFWVGAIPNLKDYYVVTYASKNGDDPDEAVNEMAAAVEKEFGKAPDVGGFVTGASTIQAIKVAYEDAKSWDGDKLAAAMEKFDEVPLLAGPTSFSPELHINVERPMRVMEVKDGKLVFVELRSPKKVTWAE